jgi:hypothetical protein
VSRSSRTETASPERSVSSTIASPDPATNWATDLTPANVDHARIGVRPERTSGGQWDWMAYTIVAAKVQ